MRACGSLIVALAMLQGACSAEPDESALVSLDHDTAIELRLRGGDLNNLDPLALQDGVLMPEAWGLTLFLARPRVEAGSGGCEWSNRGAGSFLQQGPSIARYNEAIRTLGGRLFAGSHEATSTDLQSFEVAEVLEQAEGVPINQLVSTHIWTNPPDNAFYLTDGQRLSAVCAPSYDCEVHLMLSEQVAFFGRVEPDPRANAERIELARKSQCVRALANGLIQSVRDFDADSG